jgi:predicted glycogen debranching enzyme
MIKVGRELGSDITLATSREWLITNGIGGYCSSTVPCINTRRYHGILVSSQQPPVDRVVLVSRLSEILVINGKEYPLSTCINKDKIKSPAGYLHLEKFELSPLPTWYYQIRDIMLIKTLSMVNGQNTSLVTYKFLTNKQNVTLKVRPHYLFRDFHGNAYENPGITDCLQKLDNQLKIVPFSNAPELYIKWLKGEFVEEFKWHKDILLTMEEERGLPATEDDFSCGHFEFSSQFGSASLLFSDQPIESYNPVDLKKKEEQRLEGIANSLSSDDYLLKKLLLAADQFIVNRASTNNKTILAGYPWFSDWGRDSLIALPGLTLVTGRFEDAKSILKTFAEVIKHGLIPNCFSDKSTEASYNSVDASLWFFIAIYKFIEYTDDYNFVKNHLYSGMESIVEAFMEGTINNIKMDKNDGLINAGDENTQLTWMDVKINDKAVTPRYGKAVEVNALWYNALRILAIFQEKFEGNSRRLTSLAKRVKVSYEKVFWNGHDGYLYDYVKPNGEVSASFRPNQVFAISLPFSLLAPNQEKQIIDQVFSKLYTSYGLRSLAPSEKEYEGFYTGDRERRDHCYHQGTVWGYLIGPFITAYLKANNYSMEAQLRASLMIDPFISHLEGEGCLGSVSEVFDGNMPHSPKGCFAQAWSVAELLRCYVEEIKGQKPTLII